MSTVTFTEGKQILLYSRDSWDRWYGANTEPASAWNQEFLMRLRQHGFELEGNETIVGAYNDLDVKRDAPYAQYTGLLAAVERIRRHDATEVWIPDWSRVPCLMQVQEEFFARIWHAGGKIVIGHGEVLPDRPDDPYRADFRRYICRQVEAEVMHIRHARRLKLRTMAATQHFTGGATTHRPIGPTGGSNRPYGRTWELINPVLGKYDYVAVPHEQDVIREMQQLRASGLGCRRIARALNERAEPTVTGAAWSATVVDGILRRGLFNDAR